MKKIILLNLLFFAYATHSQDSFKGNIPVDTSFTLYNAWEKVLKEFPEANLVKPQLPEHVAAEYNIVYASYDERELHLDLFYPKNNKVLIPGIILIHGGGWRSGSKNHQIPMAQCVASERYVTAAVEYRLSVEAEFPAAVHDIKAAVRWVRANADKYNIDSEKIAILGCSAGGQLASLVGFTNNEMRFNGSGNNINYSSNVQAIVNIDGLLDFTGKESKEFDKSPNKPGAAHKWFGGNHIDKHELWKDGSPLFHIDSSDVPIIFINSSIPHYHSGRDDGIKKLKEYNIYYEVHTIENTPHPFWLFHPWFDETAQYVVKFLDKVLKNKN